MSVTQREVDAALAARRLAILTLARRLADEGAHYLWGADGSRPGQGNVRLASLVLDTNRLNDTTFCAATATSDGQKYVCAGRYRALSVNGTPKPGIIRDPTANGYLKAFIGRYADRPGAQRAQYGWGAELTPRKVQGKDIIDYNAPGQPHVEDNVVWGEGCDDTLHFDCGSFVRYVVWHVCQVSILSVTSSDLSRMANPWGGLMAREVAKGEPMKQADILVYPGHVAFATEDGKPYDPVTPYYVAQAESAVYGVNYHKLHPAPCTKCIRLSDSTLLGSIPGMPGFLSWRPGGGPTADEVLDAPRPVARQQ